MSEHLTIGDLARLAGTTTRTVRHYHQIGLLPEPPRTAAGYRKYGVEDLLTLLKARRLASFGLPLDRVKEVLAASEEDASALLDELDAELRARIAALEAQRRVLAQLKRHAADPRVPEEFAPHLSALKAAGAPAAQLDRERDLILLMSSLGGREGLERLYSAQLSTAGDLSEYVELTRRLEELADAEVDAPEVAAVAAEFLRLLEPAVPELRASLASWSALDPIAEALLMERERTAASPAQWRVFEIVAAELEKRLEAETGAPG